MNETSKSFADVLARMSVPVDVSEAALAEVREADEERYAAASRAILRDQREAGFAKRCPREFHAALDFTRLPVARNVAERAMGWTGRFPGLWLWSHATGRGKTRVMWSLIKRVTVDQGLLLLERTGQQWAEEYWRAHMDGEADALWPWLQRFDVIAIDDIDKVNLADVRQQRAMRELLDVIYRQRIPAIITANEPISWLAHTVGDSGERRAREAFSELEFA